MPNDARLGLVVGVGLVVAVAFVFFKKDLPAQATFWFDQPALPAVSPAAPPADRPTLTVPGEAAPRTPGGPAPDPKSGPVLPN
jgi:hypothetical protein